jgi:MFS family permease
MVSAAKGVVVEGDLMGVVLFELSLKMTVLPDAYAYTRGQGNCALAGAFYCEGMVASYRSLLLVRGVGRLLASSVLARLPLGMCTLAILLFVRDRSGSFLDAGVAVGAFTIASAALAPAQGMLVDRLGQSRVVLPCAIGQAASLMALVASGGSPVAMVLLAAMAGMLTPPVAACLRVLWPQVTADPRACEAAYALDALTQEIIWIGGPLIVAGAVQISSAALAVLASALFTIVGSCLFMSLSLTRSWRAGPREPSAHAHLLGSSSVRALLGSACLVGITIGTLEVGLPALAGSLGSGALAGLLLAAGSTGSMLGALLYGARSWRMPLDVRYRLLLALLMILVAPLMLAHDLPLAVGFSVLAGLAVAPMFSCQYMLLSTLAASGRVAEAFTWQTAALVGGIAAGSASGGALVDVGGVAACIALGCAGAALASVLAGWVGGGAPVLGSVTPSFAENEPAIR